nr:hypothetical protein KitaXyl93_54640 [Kitasatospora sp. Xyl93]
MADTVKKTTEPAKTDTTASDGPIAEAAKAPPGPGSDLLDVQRAAGNQAAHQAAAAQPPEPSGVLGYLASWAIDFFTSELTGSGPQQQIAAAAIRGFVFTLAKEASLEGAAAGLKELATPKNMAEFVLAYEAGAILGLVSPVTNLFGIAVLAEQMQRMAIDLGRAAWEHPKELMAEARALGTEFQNFLNNARNTLTAAELLKHVVELSDTVEKAAGAAGSRAAQAVALHFSGKEEKEEPKRPGAAPAGPAAQLEQWATETRKKMTDTQWSRRGYNLGYDVGAVVSNTLLTVLSLGAGEAVAAIGAQLGRLGGLLAHAGNIVQQVGEAITAIEALIGALVSKPMKWLEPVMKPFFELLKRLRKLLGLVEKDAAKAAVTALEEGAAMAAPKPPATPKPSATKPPRTRTSEPSVRKRVATEAPKVGVATGAPKVRVATEAPKVRVATEAPKVRVATEAPKVRVATKTAVVGELEPTTRPRTKRAITATSPPKKPATAPAKSATASPKPVPPSKATPKARRKPKAETHTEDLLIDEVDVLAQQGMSTKKSLQELLQEAREGTEFEKSLASPQRRGQVPIYDKRGRRNRLDYYDEEAGEIISVKSLASKNGQIALVDEFTMLKHFQEFALKYPDKALVIEGKLAGRFVEGRYVLEVPQQFLRIPERIIELARESHVTIRDTTGRIWQ